MQSLDIKSQPISARTTNVAHAISNVTASHIPDAMSSQATANDDDEEGADLGSDLDDEDQTQEDPETPNIILCQYDKVTK